MPVGGRRPEEVTETTKAAADARKREIELNRQRANSQLGIDTVQAGIDEVAPHPEEQPVVVVDKDAEIAELKAKLAQMEADFEKSTSPEPIEAPPKAKKMPVTSQE
jgi:hypothetical protein